MKEMWCSRMTWLIIAGTLSILVPTWTYASSKAIIEACLYIYKHINKAHIESKGSFLQLIHNLIIFYLHFSPQLLSLSLTYWYLYLDLFLLPFSQLFRCVASTEFCHTLSAGSFNHKLWLGKTLSLHQGNNLLWCKNEKKNLSSILLSM